MQLLDWIGRWFGLKEGEDVTADKPELTVDEWRQEQRDQWEVSNDLLEGIRDAQGGIVTQLDEVMAQLSDAATSAEGARAAADLAVNLLNAQKDAIVALQAQVEELQAAGTTDLTPISEAIAAIDANVDAAVEQLTEATDGDDEEPVVGEEPGLG